MGFFSKLKHKVSGALHKVGHAIGNVVHTVEKPFVKAEHKIEHVVGSVAHVAGNVGHAIGANAGKVVNKVIDSGTSLIKETIDLPVNLIKAGGKAVSGVGRSLTLPLAVGAGVAAFVLLNRS